MDTEHSATSRFSVRIFTFVARAGAHLPWFFLLGWMVALSWWLTDDAFISFRYARNLLDGHGLVFNPGEHVEGYTNFLWTLELAGIWGLFGVRPEHSAPWLSVAFTAGALAAMLYQVARMSSLRRRGLVAWMSMGLLCSSATFAVWTSAGGLETRQFTFLVVAAVVLLAVHRRCRLGLLSASFSLGLASLTRPEGLLIATCCIGWFVLQSMADASGQDVRGAEGKAKRFHAVLWMLRRVDWRAVACLVLPFALMVCAHFLFRFLYYGELLPNTYHAKFVRPWWDMGLRYYTAASLETGLYLLVPLAAAGAWVRWRSHRDGIYGLVLLCVGLHVVYVTRLGGDHFEWRVLDLYWPLLAVPAADAMMRLGTEGSSVFDRIAPSMRRFHGIAPAAFALVIFALVLFYSIAMQFALLMHGADEDTLSFSDALNLQLDHQDASWLFAAPGMNWLYKTNEDLREKMYMQNVALRSAGHSQFYERQKSAFQPYDDALRGKIPEGAVAVFNSIGVSGYHLSELKIVDYHGLTDKTVARNPVLHSNDVRFMAHDRVPPYGYLDRRGVNMRIRPSERDDNHALERSRYALQLGEELWMPFDAIDHQWVRGRFGNFRLLTRYDHAKALDQADGLLDGSEPVIRSGRYDLHIVGDDLVYVKSPCTWDDTRAMFYLAVAPKDVSDLPAQGRAHGWDYHYFQVDYNFITVGHDLCVSVAELPSYEIVEIGIWPIPSHPGHTFELIYSFAAAEAMDAVEDLLQQGREPEIASVFDVFVDGGRLVYRKRPCSAVATDARFFLHVLPADANALPEDRVESGFDNLDFILWQNGGRVGDECVARAHLPSYEIASVRTGQLTLDGDEVWSDAYSFKSPDILDAVRELRRKGTGPVISSVFDVFMDRGNLIYHKRPCSAEDADARFFLHVFPADVDDLPPGHRESGFDNLDFSLWQNGGRVGDECVVRASLPEYEISEIRTGQFTPDGRAWEVKLDFTERANR